MVTSKCKQSDKGNARSCMQSDTRTKVKGKVPPHVAMQTIRRNYSRGVLASTCSGPNAFLSTQN